LPQPAIDQGLVPQALDAWSWFWIGIEAALVFVFTALAIVAGGAPSAGCTTIAATLVLAAFGLPAIRNQCAHYAVAQVRAILSDVDRAQAARAAFGDWNVERLSIRRAA